MREKNKFVFGVGINDADYKTRKTQTIESKRELIWSCPFYDRWSGMLERCYSEKYKQKQPTYQNVTCCPEWLVFSNFKKWMETQDFEGKALDKDLLVSGNQIYSSETCCFVSRQVNNFLIKRQNDRGQYPLGVCWHKQNNKFQSQLGSRKEKSKHLGYFDSALEAHKAWQKAKYLMAFELAEQETDPLVKQGLLRVANKIKNDYENNLETKDF